MKEKELLITEKVKSFEDAYNLLGLESANLPVVDMLPEKDQKSIIAFYKLTIILRALNEGWEPNWGDWDERKYYNWFYVEENGDPRSSGFRFDDTVCARTFADVGSRLCFKSKELAQYAAEQFKELYREYFFIF